MTFTYYLFWRFLPSFSRNFWLAHELLWFCQRGTEKFKNKKKFFQFFFQFFFFFWNNFFCKIFQVYIMSKWYIWFFSSEITFSYWYLKTNFVVFLSEIMELTSDRFFIYFVKQFASIYLFFSSYNKECHLLSFITAVFS